MRMEVYGGKNFVSAMVADVEIVVPGAGKIDALNARAILRPTRKRSALSGTGSRLQSASIARTEGGPM